MKQDLNGRSYTGEIYTVRVQFRCGHKTKVSAPDVYNPADPFSIVYETGKNGGIVHHAKNCSLCEKS